MDVPAILNTQFVQVALPIVFAIFLGTHYQNKRLDDLRSDMNRRFTELQSEMNRRFDEVIKRLEKIDAKLENHNERITRVEERTSPLHR